ncbi:hypothetical protein [Pseudooceanicola sp. 200-1SW]|uniref:hypothetical protein n=1 Tax=Pseudooceanicola sp. 200-1SW TaxID=3425949 RepID=UPI003D7F5108
MAKAGWHRLREEDAVTIARRLPVRFDLAVEARLPCARPVSLTRVAHQVRQDMWRRLQGLRGFSPAVEVRQEAGHLTIRAGGTVAGALPATARDTLAELLDSPTHRARWLAHAGRRADG